MNINDIKYLLKALLFLLVLLFVLFSVPFALQWAYEGSSALVNDLTAIALFVFYMIGFWAINCQIKRSLGSRR